MRRAIALAATVVALVDASAAYGGSLPDDPPLATYANFSGDSFLGRLDPVTLRRRGPRLNIPEYHRASAFSPDGRRLAIGKSAGGPAAGIGGWIVNPRTMRVTVGIRAPIAVEGLAWVTPRRLVMFLQGTGVQVADPVTGDIVARSGVAPRCDGRSASTSRLLVVLASRSVATFDGRGRRRLARLGPRRPDACDDTGFAAAGGHAYVMGARSTALTSVDLRTMRVRDRRLRGPARRGIAPELRAIGGGRLVATYVGRRARGAGVEVIEARRGTRRLLDRRAGRAAHSARFGLVLAHDALNAIGLTAYRPGGRRAFRLLRGRRIENVQVKGRFAYAIERRRVSIVDLRRGRVVSRSGRPAGQVIQFLAPGV